MLSKKISKYINKDIEISSNECDKEDFDNKNSNEESSEKNSDAENRIMLFKQK